tara:strand:- start:285 stop:452 length:168 start_codon:yes stop_codon:yes gene_type:complete
VSKIIKSINPNYVISGNSISPRSGAFEIKMDEKLVYSKFNTSKFPTKQELREIFK